MDMDMVLGLCTRIHLFCLTPIGCWFRVKDDDRRGVFIGDVEDSALAAADAEGDPEKHCLIY